MIFMKRHNPYSIEDVIKKYNISYEEANIKIQELKKRTTITLENLVRKHGEEEGRKRFESFKQKSAHTKEKYMEKYGDEWEEHWNKYLKSKSCSLEKFIERYGEVDGTKMFEQYQAKKSYSNSLACYIEKYGEAEGSTKYEAVQRKRNASTLSHFVEKFGKEEGLKKYDETNLRKNTRSLGFYVNKYGEQLGSEKYEESKMKCSPLFLALKKEYGEEFAIVTYSKYKDKKFDVIGQDLNLILPHKTSIKSKRLSKGPVSKESNIFFKLLEFALERKLTYGKKSDELKLINVDTCRYYCYDCYDEVSNTIIEFHGVTWHPKEGQLEWTNPFGAPYFEKRKKDLCKKELAESKGYKYIVVYSDEVNTVDKRNDKIIQLKEIINGNRKEN